MELATPRHQVTGISLERFIQDSQNELEKLQLDAHPLKAVCDRGLPRDREGGLWLEFGVGTGTTLGVLSAARRHGLVYGFDWFQGLPEEWLPEFGLGKGSFAMDPPAEVPPNARLVHGRFEDTLAPFLAEHSGLPVDLAHVDCDVYGSTVTVLNGLTDRLPPGAVMVFDELFFYEGCEGHEAKALYEWLSATGKAYRWIGIQGHETGADVNRRAMDDPALKRTFLGPGNGIVPWDVPLKERAALILVE
ncbi:MAG: class I SAM-dependent methyltransferase [Verrucomicrobiota bacterium]